MNWAMAITTSVSDAKLYVILIVLADQLSAICVTPRHCIEDMEESDARERFDYVLSKYEELEMKIIGQPISLHGKLVTHGEVKEQHIEFQYLDNTLHDIIQNCAFVVTKAPGECETIETVCNAFLGRTPRPLLERKPLTVCEDGVHETEAETEPTTVDATAPSPSQPTDADIANDSELI